MTDSADAIARRILARVEAGTVDLRVVAEAMGEKWDQDAPRAVLDAAMSITALRQEVADLEANQWPFGKRPNPVVGHTFGDFAVYGDEKSMKRVRAAMHEYDAMMPERIRRINEQAAQLASLTQRVKEWQDARKATLAEPVANTVTSPSFRDALNRLANAEDALARALRDELTQETK